MRTKFKGVIPQWLRCRRGHHVPAKLKTVIHEGKAKWVMCCKHCGGGLHYKPMPSHNIVSEAQKLHDQAMDAAEIAYVHKMRGNENCFETATRNAFELERQAAALLGPYIEYEPSRSVLHRSAAALALDLKEWRAAEQLACTALIGNPPEDVAMELRDMREQCQLELYVEEWEEAVPVGTRPARTCKCGRKVPEGMSCRCSRV